MTGFFRSGKLPNMMFHILSAVVFAACVVTPLAYADALPTGPSQTSATIIVHPDVLSAKKGEVPLDPQLCRPGTFGQIHIVNERVHVCRKRG